MIRVIQTLLLLACTISVFSQSTEITPWASSQEPAQQKRRVIVPNIYRTVKLDESDLRSFLANVPQEFSGTAQSEWPVLGLPKPDGSIGRFRVCESPIMQSGLAQRFPEIKTYLGKGIDDPTAYIRFDLTPKGFHAMVLTTEGSWFIDPYYFEHSDYYISYFTRDFTGNDEGFTCEFKPESTDFSGETTAFSPLTGETLRIYRLAQAATGEYTNFQGGTVNQALAAITTTINRVNTVYEREFSVRMMLIDNTTQVIFTNGSSDPYTGGSANKMNQNQGACDNNVGSANYDIGHVFDVSDGGIASLGSVCDNTRKARGYTGTSNPVGDPFDIDYVAHEMGHQFGGNHTFNSNMGSCEGNRNSGTAFEPGSGSTIMAYAGICGSDNVQLQSNDYFHGGSLSEMTSYIIAPAGASCATTSVTDNTAPVAEAGPSGMVIPIQTPFELTGSATDAEDTGLSYGWEEYDTGASTELGQPTGNAPQFRSYPLANVPVRVFPRLSNLLANTGNIAEIMPYYNRTLRFRLSVRDNHAGAGGVDWDNMQLTVSNAAGPFRVLSGNTPETWTAGSFQFVQWDPANTAASPVNAANVDIYLVNTDDFYNPILLVGGTPNDGYEMITVPEGISGNNYRIKVKGAGNVFFDLNNANITINDQGAPGVAVTATTPAMVVCGGENAVYDLNIAPLQGYQNTLSIEGDNLPSGLNFSTDPADFMLPAFPTLTLTGTENLPTGDYTLNFNITAAGFGQPFSVDLRVFDSTPENIQVQSPADNANGVPVDIAFAWDANTNATLYDIDIATDPDFTQIVASATDLTDPFFEPESNLADSTRYYWRVRGSNPYCGAGSYTPTNTFFTEIVRCDRFFATDTPKAFNAAPFIFSRVTIPDDLLIRDMNIVEIKGQGNPLGNLSFRLTGPDGANYNLVGAATCNGSSFDFNIDNEALPGPLPCPYNIGGTYRPLDSFAGYYGGSAKGEWRLFVFDQGAPGQLASWAIEVCYPKAPDGVREEIAANGGTFAVFPNPSTGEATFTADLPAGADLRLRITDLAGREVYGFNPGKLSSGEHRFQVSLANLPQGMYLYRWLDEQGGLWGSGKVVKQ